MADLSRRLNVLNLKPAEASALLLIEANPGMTQGAVGRVLGIKSANMVPLAGKLEQRGWLDRERVDGRSHGLQVTKSGTALCKKIRGAIAAQEAVISAAVPEDLRDPIMPALALVRTSLQLLELPERERPQTAKKVTASNTTL